MTRKEFNKKYDEMKIDEKTVIPIEELDHVEHRKGDYVIIRTNTAGTWYGKFVRLEGPTNNIVVLTEARRKYSWVPKGKGISLSSLCKEGIAPDSRIQNPLRVVYLQWIEILSVSEAAVETFRNQPEFKRV